MSNSKPPSDAATPVTIHIKPPYGYRVAGNRLEVDPAETQHIASLFRQYVQGR